MKTIRRLIKSSGITEEQRKITFDKLDPKRSNSQMYWMAKQYLDEFHDIAAMDTEAKGIGFAGSVGTGKTTLLIAVANGLIVQQIPVLFVNTSDLVAELYDAQWGRDEETLNTKIHKVSTAKLVIFDDVGKEKITDWVRAQYYRIINHRYANRLPTCFTSNLNFDEIADQVGDATASRLYALTKGWQIHIDAEDYRLV
jgi:DNA replication protein DnaC